jgi:hypothetical protein
LKPEWWGSPLVLEEKYQEKAVKIEEMIIIIITITIIIIIIICKMKAAVFWDIVSLVHNGRRFRRAYCLHY